MLWKTNGAVAREAVLTPLFCGDRAPFLACVKSMVDLLGFFQEVIVPRVRGCQPPCRPHDSLTLLCVVWLYACMLVCFVLFVLFKCLCVCLVN